MTAAVVTHGGAHGFWNLVDATVEIVERPRCQLWRLFNRGVEIGDLRLMMFAVMNLHRLRVDMRLEGFCSVRQRGKDMGHSDVSNNARGLGKFCGGAFAPPADNARQNGQQHDHDHHHLDMLRDGWDRSTEHKADRQHTPHPRDAADHVVGQE